MALCQAGRHRCSLTHLAFPHSVPAAMFFQDKFDVTLLHTKPGVAAQERMVDDGSGKVEVRDGRSGWTLAGGQLHPM